MNAKILALSLLLAASLAQASDSDAMPYRYGSQPEVNQVLKIETAPSRHCEVTTAVMTYRDSAGALRRMSYLTSSEACTKQN